MRAGPKVDNIMTVELIWDMTGYTSEVVHNAVHQTVQGGL